MMKPSLLCTVTAALLLSVALVVQTTSAQVSISSLAGGTYTQDFGSLAGSGSTNTWVDNSTLEGWYAATNTSSGVVRIYSAGAGTGTTGRMYSFGTNGVNPATDRALGSIASGTSGPLAYGVRFANDTGSAISSITITYTGEQWRNAGNVSAQTLAFSYLVSASPITSPAPANTSSWTPFTALDFTTPTVGTSAGALDGNASANRVVFSGVLLAGAAVPAGSEIFLRWRDADDSGSDHALAIDDLTVTFSTGAVITNAPTYAAVAPPAQTNKAGTSAFFAVTSDGYPGLSLSYQWRKDGVPLSDLGNIYGSATPTLTVSNLLAADAAGYDVIVANSAGSVTSAAATLTVVDPAISSQSASQARFGGESANLTVSAKGTPPLAYQWFFGSNPIEGATGSALPLSNLQSTDQGTYTCWVTNNLGATVASAPITLTVTVFPSLTLALWDFNNTNAPVASPAPAVGTGAAFLLNGVEASFVSGVSSDHSASGTNAAWNTLSYPIQGSSNQTAGVQFSVSTLGYQNICLAWNQRHSSTASKYTRVQYTTDGAVFTDLDLNTMSADNTFVFLSRDLSAIPAVNDNPNFAFRIVSAFESPDNPNYVGTSGTYRTTGTIRFDLVRVYGDPLGGVAPATISRLIGNTLTYAGGAGAQFVLLRSLNAAAPLSGWTRVATNSVTPGTFTVPAGSGNAAFYRIKSE